MEKRTEIFLGSYLYPVLVPATLALGTILLSKHATGDWLRYLKSMPATGWAVIGGVVTVWILLVGVCRRAKRVRAENDRRGPLCFSVPAFGYQEVNEFRYKEVLWAVRVPAPPPWHFGRSEPPFPGDIDVATPPRCPKCKTDLEQKKTFWGRYRWSCPRPGCNFAITNAESFYAECERAEKIARSDYREFLRRSGQ